MHAAPDIRAMPGAVLAVTAAAGAAGWGRLWLDVRLFEADVLAGVNQLEHEAKQQGCDVYDYLRNHVDRVRTVHLKQIDGDGNNVDLPDGILDMAEVIRCAPHATDYILEQASFREGIPQSLQRNAAFMKTL